MNDKSELFRDNLLIIVDNLMRLDDLKKAPWESILICTNYDYD